MADFHPKTHQDTLGQLHQSLEELKDSLTVIPAELQGRAQTGQPFPQPEPESCQIETDWESALESAAADIDNYFNPSTES